MKVIFATLLLCLLVVGCTQQAQPTPTGAPTAEPTQTPTQQPTATGATITPTGTQPASVSVIQISNFAFAAPSIEVAAGATVTWRNSDSVAHTATSDSGQFDTGLIQPGASASHTFTTPGTYAYHCAPHPNMKATIVVK